MKKLTLYAFVFLVLTFSSVMIVFAWNSATTIEAPSLDSLAVDFSNNSKLIAVGSYEYVEIYNTSDWSLVKSINHGLSYTDNVEFAPNNELFAYSEDDFVHIYNTTDWTNIINLTNSTETYDIAFSPNSEMIAFGCGDDGSGNYFVHIYNTSDWTEISYVDTTYITRSIAFSPDNEKMALATLIADNGIMIQNTTDWTNIVNWTENASYHAYGALEYSPDGNILAVTNRNDGSSESRVDIWNVTDLSSIEKITTLQNDTQPYYQNVAWSQDGQWLSFGEEFYGTDNLFIYNTTDWSLETTLTDASQDINDVTFSNNGKWIAWASDDDDLYIYNLPAPSNVTTPIISPATAYTNSDLTANTTYSDLNGDTDDVTFKWYVNDTNVYNQTFSSVTSGTVVNSTLGSGNFSKNNVINVSVQSNGSSVYWSDELTISNSIPTVPSLTAEGDTHTDTFVGLDWSASSDADSDSLDYNVIIGTSSGEDDLGNWTGVSDTNQTTDTNLTAWDTDFYWSVQACDDAVCSAWATSDIFKRTNTPPPYPSMTDEPNFHSGFNVTLDWTSGGADSDGDSVVYNIRIGTSSGEDDLGNWTSVSDLYQLTDNNLTAWDTDFYWEVQGCDDSGAPDNCSAWNSEDTFQKTNEAPDLTVNITSNDGNKTNSTLTCGYNCSDSDSDTCDSFVIYKWFNNSVIISGQTASTLAGTHFSKDDNLTCEVTIEDNSGAPDNQTILNTTTLTILNSAPLSNFTTEITPATAYTNDTLTASNTSGVYDEDGDSITLTYKWFNDSGLIAGETTSTLADTFFVKYDNITAEITATDDDGGSASVNTTIKTISNSVPLSNFTTEITPATAYTNDTLTISNTSGVYDEDGDSITLTYKWFNDSGLIDETTSTLADTFFVKYDNITAEITASDGVSNSSVNTTRTISNIAPTFDEIITSISKFHNENLTIQLNATDLDGDDLTWADNTSLFNINSTGYIFDNPIQAETGNHSIMANVTDGTNTINLSFTYEIINRAPTISSASITPDPADVLDNLTCNNGSVSDSDGDTTTLEYNWYNNSALTSITTKIVGSGNLSAGDEWYCKINVTDGLHYSGAVTSQTVIIDSLQTAPTLNWTNATTASTLITSDSTNPTQNNSWVNLSVIFADANSGEKHTAYFCKTNAFSGECDGDTFCVSGINSSATPELSCRYNLSSETSMNVSYYVYVIDNASLHQGSGSGLEGQFVVNYPPDIPAIITVQNNSWVTTNSTILEFSSTDPDGDIITYLVYGVENGTDYSLINATQSTFNWTNLNETYYYFKVRANDSHGYLTDLNSSVVVFKVDYTAPTLSLETYTGDIYTDETESITIDCADGFSGVNSSLVYYNITTPILTTTVEYMTSFRNNTFIDNYVPLGSVGTYTVEIFTCYDLAGNANTLESNISFTASTRTLQGGGGGGTKTIIQSVTSNATTPVFCGDGICGIGENPGNCLADCKINFDSLITCWFTDPKTCLYSESWFVNILIFIIIVAVIIIVTAENKSIYKSKKKKKK